MSTYAIIAPAADPRLKIAIDRVFPEKNFEFAPGQFVATRTGLTSTQLAAEIGTNEQVGQYVIFSVSGYWGFHRRDLWEWLTANAG